MQAKDVRHILLIFGISIHNTERLYEVFDSIDMNKKSVLIEFLTLHIPTKSLTRTLQKQKI